MDWLRQAALTRPEAAALITRAGTLTYAEMDHAADAVAAIVAGSGLAEGAVAFWGEHDPATVAAVWGIPRAGATAVAIDPSLPPAESMHLTREAGARGLWAMLDGGIDALLRRPRPAGGFADGMPGRARFIVFTSGSEGRRKGVVLTGDNAAAAVAASQERLGNGADDPWLAVLPLFHVGGLSILWRQAATAAPVVLEPEFDVTRCVRLLPTVAFASVVPTMLHRLIEAGARGGGALRGVLVGGGPADPALLRRALAAGIPALQTYGMTETCSQVCTVAPRDAEGDLGTAGRPLRGAEVAIGTDGRIRVRGPMVAAGYHGEAPRDDDWFVTGDLGEIDPAGRLVVLGRADAVIVTGGENVNPMEVERVLRRIPGVVDVRVYGEPDPEWGQRVVAEVVLADVEVETVSRQARAGLRPAQVPRRWEVVPRIDSKLE
jgi:o-succinylbenzoate---CoA ligase